MKTQTAAKIKLGLFVSLGVLLFMIAIYSIGKRQRLFGTTFTISSIFYDVSGLQIGNNVRFSGITVGTVNNIRIISDSLVKVDMIIEENVRQFIKKDARAVIGSEGLMGNKVVNILPGGNGTREVSNNDVILSEKIVDIDNLLKNIQATAKNLEIITGDLAKISSMTSSGRGLVGGLLMDTAVSNYINQTFKNIQEGTQGFQENMEAAKGSLLLRGHFNKKEKEKEKLLKKEEKKKETLDQKEEKDKNSNKRKGFFRRKSDNS